jgi:hypothetical protein
MTKHPNDKGMGIGNCKFEISNWEENKTRGVL